MSIETRRFALPGLRVILEDLECILGGRALLGALNDLAVNAQSQNVGRYDVVVRQRSRLDGQAGAGAAYDGQQEFVNSLEALLSCRGLLHGEALCNNESRSLSLRRGKTSV